MSGITDLPIRTCNGCGAVWMEDDRMYEEPDRCPGCGVRAGPPEYEGDRDEVDW